MRPSVTADPLWSMIGLLQPRLPRLALAVVFGVLSLGSALALAGVSAWLITRAWEMPPVLHLTVAVTTVRALGISRGVFHYCERLASHDTALRAAGTARTELYQLLAEAPEDVATRLPSGELVARVGVSVDEVADVLVRAVLPIAVSVVLAVAAVSVIAVISPTAALILAGCLLIAGVLAPRLAAQAAMSAEAVASQHHSDRDSAAMLALEHAPELRVNGQLDALITVADEQHRSWGDATDKAAAPAAVAAAVTTAAIGAAVLGTVVVAIPLATTVAPTTVAILMLLPLSAFEATTALPGATVQLSRSRIAARRLLELTDPVTDSRPRPSVPIPNIAPGERLAVVGPSGSGKTTLLMDIADRYSGGSGSQATFFAEDAHLFDTTVRDNLLVARGDATDDALQEALQRVGLGRWLDTLPDGLGTILVGGAARVSAGQRRRLLLARALLSPAPIVLLDEPTEHLDASDAAQILTDLLTPGAMFPPDRAVVVATHHLPADLRCPTLNLADDRYAQQS